MPRRRKATPAMNTGHTLHLADEFHPDPRIAAKAADENSKRFTEQIRLKTFTGQMRAAKRIA